MQVQIHTDIDFNPRGLHENSGTRQWLHDTLVAIQEPTTINSKYRIVELPARLISTCEPRANGRHIRFDTRYQAECWIERNYSAAVIIVTFEDLTEEIARRRAIAALESEENDD